MVKLNAIFFSFAILAAVSMAAPTDCQSKGDGTDIVLSPLSGNEILSDNGSNNKDNLNGNKDNGNGNSGFGNQNGGGNGNHFESVKGKGSHTRKQRRDGGLFGSPGSLNSILSDNGSGNSNNLNHNKDNGNGNSGFGDGNGGLNGNHLHKKWEDDIIFSPGTGNSIGSDNGSGNKHNLDHNKGNGNKNSGFGNGNGLLNGNLLERTEGDDIVLSPGSGNAFGSGNGSGNKNNLNHNKGNGNGNSGYGDGNGLLNGNKY